MCLLGNERKTQHYLSFACESNNLSFHPRFCLLSVNGKERFIYVWRLIFVCLFVSFSVKCTDLLSSSSFALGRVGEWCLLRQFSYNFSFAFCHRACCRAVYIYYLVTTELTMHFLFFLSSSFPHYKSFRFSRFFKYAFCG